MTQAAPTDFLTAAELSELINIPATTLTNWRYLGKHGPAYYKFGNQVRYARRDVERWIAEQRVG